MALPFNPEDVIRYSPVIPISGGPPIALLITFKDGSQKLFEKDELTPELLAAAGESGS